MKKLLHWSEDGKPELTQKFLPRRSVTGKTPNQTTMKSHIQNLLLLLALCTGACQAAAQNFVIASMPKVGTFPYCVCAADVNGDGKVDLISANSRDNTLTVLTNNGSGGFVTASTLTVGDEPKSVCAADINGDGKLDLICANCGYGPNGNSLTVLTNNGSGDFAISGTYKVVP